MENRKLLKKILPFALIIISAAIARLVPHPPNFAPVGALAIFTGYHFKNKWSWTLPVAAMVLSDLVIGFHPTIPYVYGSFIIMSLIGSRLGKGKAGTLLAASLTSSLVFFLITNFGSFVTGSMYVKSATGLMQSYLMGLPFLRNTLASDVIYTFFFFYGFKYATRLLHKNHSAV